MEKELYEKCEVEIIRWGAEDVIITSPGDDTDIDTDM